MLICHTSDAQKHHKVAIFPYKEYCNTELVRSFGVVMSIPTNKKSFMQAVRDNALAGTAALGLVLSSTFPAVANDGEAVNATPEASSTTSASVKKSYKFGPTVPITPENSVHVDYIIDKSQLRAPERGKLKFISQVMHSKDPVEGLWRAQEESVDGIAVLVTGRDKQLFQQLQRAVNFFNQTRNQNVPIVIGSASEPSSVELFIDQEHIKRASVKPGDFDDYLTIRAQLTNYLDNALDNFILADIKAERLASADNSVGPSR